MALAFSQPSQMAPPQDDDELMLDIDMDVDEVPLMEEDLLEEGEEVEPGPSVIATDQSGIIPAIYTEDPLQEPQPEKIHVRGLEDWSEEDVISYTREYFPQDDSPRIQWIDDVSANLIFPSRDISLQAILAFISAPTTADDINNSPLELRSAKPSLSRPSSQIQVRIAVAGDRKKKGARHESRYYLFHPEADPGEYKRRRFDNREHRRRRDQDDIGDDPSNHFTASMYDDAPATDGEATNGTRGGSRMKGGDLFDRIRRPEGGRLRRRRSASPGRDRSHSVNTDEIEIEDSSSSDDRRRGGRTRRPRNPYRDRNVRTPPPLYTERDPNPFPKSNFGRELLDPPSSKRSLELFPSSSKPTLSTGRLNSSTSPTSHTSSTTITQTQQQSRSSANALRAQRLKADLLSANSQNPSPTSPSRSRHQRSNAMDAKTELDLSNYTRKSLSIDSTVSATGVNSGKELFGPPLDLPSSFAPDGGVVNENGLNIRGSAASSSSAGRLDRGQGFSIKGLGGFSIKGRAATKEEVQELFPSQYEGGGGGARGGSGRGGGGGGRGVGVGKNEGKELFDQPVRERRERPRGDLFWD